MSSLSDTIARLSGARSANLGTIPASAGRLQPMSQFGSNPGNLTAKHYIPDDLPCNAPLVVVLHGCGQDAAGYDHGAGWSTLADRYGFALLFPEQNAANNPNRCFNWFTPENTQRGSGDALSIYQMVVKLQSDCDLDPERTYITGLSAGGAMTSVMLATYPEVFAGGAIIAGLAYGSAADIPQAFARMRGQGGPAADSLPALVRAASDHEGPWPTISVWHGSGDTTVVPANAEAIVSQWRTIHGVAVEPDRSEMVDGYPRMVWTDAEGRDVIEEYSITGMGHGTPLSTQGEEGYGAAGAFMLEAAISSTQRIAEFWGISVRLFGR